MSNPATSLTFTTPLPSAGTITFKATKKGPAKGSVSSSASGAAHIYSINTISGTTIEKQITSRKLQAELDAKLGPAESALLAHYSGATEIRFNFPRGIILFKQGKKQVTLDLGDVKKALGTSYQPIQDLLDTAIKINPAFKKRNYQPIDHSLGNRFGSKHVLKHSNPVLQSMNRPMNESAQDAIEMREKNQGKKLRTRERKRLFSRMAATQTIHNELKSQVDKKVKSCEKLPDHDPTKKYWNQVQEEIEEIDRPGLMTAAALMPHNQTAQSVARLAQQLLTYNDLPPIDREFAIDKGALVFSGLSSAEGRMAYAAHYDKHHIRPKQESLTGLVLRAAIRDEDQGDGLKSAWVRRLDGTAKQKQELEAMIDRAMTKANAKKKKIQKSKTAPATGETLAQKYEKSFAPK